ncbi:bifunctional deaminase-reductase domain protein [Kribbella flavida DSM 17836]|uniref:Bifunctional deaminase-reductase domain protein n=1 Tax=Kribbella flavida (strain DSM 17836 / JCM 10339 / NBRC 14399) TaxID=479435 RepID=D2Q4T1_KRIFD|nr:pyrimidine reductase family protein [Kribbella flavida]ADB34186.1 bifunctional deaminase-reductase domain protein [Kribbella flavida DSM 17836]
MRPLSELTEAEVIAAYQVADRSVPHLRCNFVTSIDGAMEVEGKSKALSGAADQEIFGKLRMLSDVVLVGAGTVRIEGYRPLRLSAARREWRRAQGLPENPTLAIVSSRLDLDPASPFLAEAPVRPIVFTHTASPLDAREALAEVADVVVCGRAGVDLRAVMKTLVERGLPQVLSEGGPHLLGALTAADLVDEMCLSLAPVLAGPGSGRITAGPTATAIRSFALRSLLAGDDGFLFFRYLREA